MYPATKMYTAKLLAIKNTMCWIMANNHNKVAISDSLSSLEPLDSIKSKSRPELLH
jgi:hypothetical protein